MSGGAVVLRCPPGDDLLPAAAAPWRASARSKRAAAKKSRPTSDVFPLTIPLLEEKVAYERERAATLLASCRCCRRRRRSPPGGRRPTARQQRTAKLQPR